MCVYVCVPEHHQANDTHKNVSGLVFCVVDVVSCVCLRIVSVTPVEIMSIVTYIHTCRESIERLSSVLCNVSFLHVSSVTYFISGIENIFFLFAFDIFFAAAAAATAVHFFTRYFVVSQFLCLLLFFDRIRTSCGAYLWIVHIVLVRLNWAREKCIVIFFRREYRNVISRPSDPRVYFMCRTMINRMHWVHIVKAFNSEYRNKCALFSELFSCISSIESIFPVLSLYSHRIEHGSSFYDFFRFSCSLCFFFSVPDVSQWSIFVGPNKNYEEVELSHTNVSIFRTYFDFIYRMLDACSTWAISLFLLASHNSTKFGIETYVRFVCTSERYISCWMLHSMLNAQRWWKLSPAVCFRWPPVESDLCMFNIRIDYIWCNTFYRYVSVCVCELWMRQQYRLTTTTEIE